MTIGSRNDFSDGLIRIEPPVQISEDYLDMFADEGDLEFGFIISGKESTLVSFMLNNSVTTVGNIERVSSSTESLIENLRYISSASTFMTQY